MIKPSDLAPLGEDLAIRILITARSIAPCLDSLEDGAGDDDPKPRRDAIAILKAVGTNGGMRGSHLIKSQRTASSAVEYNAGSWWSDDDRASLRSLCPATSAVAGDHPVGQFPATARVIKNMWPEENC